VTELDYQLVMKWIFIVVVAGFLGRYGETFATFLIERAKRKPLLRQKMKLFVKLRKIDWIESEGGMFLCR
jgi:hypothetical protein